MTASSETQPTTSGTTTSSQTQETGSETESLNTTTDHSKKSDTSELVIITAASLGFAVFICLLIGGMVLFAFLYKKRKRGKTLHALIKKP